MTEKIRILTVLPIVQTDGLKPRRLLEDRKKLAEEIDQLTGGLVDITTHFPQKGTESVDTHSYDLALNIPYILERVKEAEEGGYDAVVIDCMADPGLDAARELVNIPVVGANESSCHLAAQIAPKFSIINIIPNVEYRLRILATQYGFLQHLASIVNVSIPVLELTRDPEKSIAKITEAAEKAVREDGASAIVFGCTGMASLVEEVKSQLKAKGLNIPVIEPLRAAIYNAVAWVLMGVNQSKEAYRSPGTKLMKR
jgi:allantoin racemase